MLTKRFTRLFLFAAAAALLAPALHAALSKYKDWASSPEAYFLTKEERAKWDTLDSDAAAEGFIAEYRAVRGKGFAAAIQSRIDFADKNFKLGKKRGSETLRGKTLIILGPPTKVVQGAGGSGGSGKIDPSSGDLLANSGGGDKSGGGSNNAYSNAGGGGDTLRSMAPVTKTVTYSWLYDDKNVPPTVKAKDLTLEFTVEPDNNKEEARDRQKLDELLASVVEYWKPKPKA